MSFSSGYSSSEEVSTSSSSSEDEMFSVNMADVPLIQMATGFVEEPKAGAGLKETLDDGYYEEELEDESKMGGSSASSQARTPKGSRPGEADEEDMPDRSEVSEVDHPRVGSLMADSSADTLATIDDAPVQIYQERKAAQAEEPVSPSSVDGGERKKKKHKKKRARGEGAAKAGKKGARGWTEVFENAGEAAAAPAAADAMARTPSPSIAAGSPMPPRLKDASKRNTITRDFPLPEVVSPRQALALKSLPAPTSEPQPKPLSPTANQRAQALVRSLSPRKLLEKLSPRKKDPNSVSPTTSPRSSSSKAAEEEEPARSGGAEGSSEQAVYNARAQMTLSPTQTITRTHSDQGPQASTEDLPLVSRQFTTDERKKKKKKDKDRIKREKLTSPDGKEKKKKKKKDKEKEKDPNRVKKRKKDKAKRRQKAEGSASADGEGEALMSARDYDDMPASARDREEQPMADDDDPLGATYETKVEAIGALEAAESEEEIPLTGRDTVGGVTAREAEIAREEEEDLPDPEEEEAEGANGILDLSFSELEIIEQEAITEWLKKADPKSISSVNLSYNTLKDVPSFSDLPNLVRLSLAGNCLLEIPKTVQSLSNLQVLDLRCNKLVRLPPEVSNLPNLTTLLLSNNNLQIIPRNVGYLKQLEILNVSNNVICRLPRSTQELTSLRVLDCHENELVKLPNLGKLVNLTHLNCSGNMMNALPYDFNGTVQPFVSMVHLANNCFRSVPVQNLERFSLLEYLDLDGNTIELLPPSIRALTSLKQLFLSRNKISFIAPELGMLTSLYRLHMDHNRIADLPEHFQNLSSLRELSLSYNAFTEVPSVLLRMPLLSLNLSSNQIESFPEDLGELESLDTLNLSDNLIKELSPAIGKLTRLSTLLLECNLLTSLPDELTGCTKLSLLNLAQNEITELPEVGPMQRLQDLILWDNQLDDMPDSICMITTFHSLQVTGNPMSNIPPYCHAGGSELWTYLYQRHMKDE